MAWTGAQGLVVAGADAGAGWGAGLRAGSTADPLMGSVLVATGWKSCWSMRIIS
jgi:hypothetical protein